SCPSLWVGHLKTKKAGMDAIQDHSKNARQFSGLSTLQTHTQGTNSSHAVDLPVAQLDLDVFQSDRQLAPTVATNALIQRTTPLPLVQGQLVQILEGFELTQDDVTITRILKPDPEQCDANDGVMNVRVSRNVTQDSIAEGKERAIIYEINKGLLVSYKIFVNIVV
ncbi:MAG: hypothetical protein EZS28_046900, partial [Streblomastix strix]